jgi:hypothetical protein
MLYGTRKDARLDYFFVAEDASKDAQSGYRPEYPGVNLLNQSRFETPGGGPYVRKRLRYLASATYR